MAKDKPIEQRPLEREWFEAASRGDLSRMRTALAGGVDINCRDPDGRTALFHATAPFGGHEEMVRWLVGQGSDVNLRDNSGKSALEFGHDAVTSALELNMIGMYRKLFDRHVYRESAREIARRPKPPGPPPRRKLSDFWGRWTIDSGGDRGAEVRISSARIRSDLARLKLKVDSHELDSEQRLVLRGQDGDRTFQLTVKLHGNRVAVLCLEDGGKGPRLEIRIMR